MRTGWNTAGTGDERGLRLGVDARWNLYPEVWVEGQLWQLQMER